MVPEVVVDWLQNKPEYAKAIVHLAGMKTADVPGLVVEVAAFWEGTQFLPPVTISIPIEQGRISWTPNDPTPKLYARTLGAIVETFKQMVIPQNMVVMGIVLSDQTKKPHFRKFSFRKDAFPPREGDEIWLRKKSWQATELEHVVKELLRLKRKLRGCGYAD